MGFTAFAKSFVVWSSSSLAALSGCGGDEIATLGAAFANPPTLPEPPKPSLPRDCTQLQERAQLDSVDATLLPVLCPDVPLSPVTARLLLLSADSADAARRRIPLLAPFPELTALAKLVAQIEVDVVVDARVPSPATAIVTPLSDEVLATAQLARAQLLDPTLGSTAHTIARGYLAKVYVHALRQLGVDPTQPPPPLVRLLAAQAIHHGRTFCDAYLRRRVKGLWPVCAEVERTILASVLTLESDSSAGDVPLAVHELVSGRRYLARKDVKTRLDKLREADGPQSVDRMAPIASELPRLIEHGLLDLALSRAATMRKQGNLPWAAIETLLQTELGTHEGDEYMERLAKRIDKQRKTAAGSQPGRLEHAADPSWPTASEVARTQLESIEAADSDFTRRYALGRAVLTLRARPDALRIAIERARSAELPSIATAVPLLRAVLDERDDGRLANLRRQAATDDRIVVDAAAAHRRGFALVAREAGDAPR